MMKSRGGARHGWVMTCFTLGLGAAIVAYSHFAYLLYVNFGLSWPTHLPTSTVREWLVIWLSSIVLSVIVNIIRVRARPAPETKP